MMENSIESCVPPGFRFHPTDEELVGYYLKKKIASEKIDLDVIRDIDLYRIEPWDIQERCRIGYEEQNEWYFFSYKDKKYPTGTRTNRATMAGFWKATGRDKAVYDKSKLIGMRKTLVFYTGRAPNGHKTDWIMHEYRLECDQDNGPPHSQEEGWVVCRAFKKRATGQTKSNEGIWDSTYIYDELSGVSSALDPIEFDYSCTKQPQNQKFLARNCRIPCKQETEADNLNFAQRYSDQFVQLPQLESPSPPPIKKPHSKDHDQTRGYEYNHRQKVTDWRALDRFVASQLSQEERYVSEGAVSNFGEHNNNTDIALLLLQSGEEEAEKINGFLSSSPEFDNGVCIFDK